jgi:putative hydrolase of the HAD superfamily
MDGYFSMNRKMVRGRMSETAARPNPMRRVPAQPLLASLAVVSADSDTCKSRSANGNKTLPASVRATLRRVRAKSAPPTFASSLRICLLSAGWDMESRSADLRKCNSRAKMLKDFSSYKSSSMPECYHCLYNDSLDATTGMPEDSERRPELLTKSRHHPHEASPIKAVILDYGEVISFPPGEKEFAAMAAVLGVVPDLFRSMYPTDRAAYDRGDLTPAAYWRRFAERAHVKLKLGRIKELRRLDVEMWSRVNPEMVRWIACLSDAGLKTALLSNMISDMAVHARQEFSWLNRLTFQVLSCQVRLVKPDRAIYERCLKGLRVRPSETLFVDDSAVNVEAARALGITSIRFRSMTQLREELAALSLPPLPPFSRQPLSIVSPRG